MPDYSAEHKVPPYTIQRTSNTDPMFYVVLGPLLSRREVVSELGAPVWDDNDKKWLIAVTDLDEVLGMIAVRAGREMCSFYVTPNSRGRSVGYALLHNAILGTNNRPLKATVTAAGLSVFNLAGFSETGKRGAFHLLSRET